MHDSNEQCQNQKLPKRLLAGGVGNFHFDRAKERFNMEQLRELLYKYLNQNLVQIIISNPRNREAAGKIHLRPVLVKDELVFQASEYKEKKVYHKNLTREEAVSQMLCWMEVYRQLETVSQIGQAMVLVSKKGKITIKEKKTPACVKQVDLSHNRKKKYILEPEKKVEFLVDLGVQNREGKIVHAKYNGIIN